jgi:hypothetical protein
VRPTGAQTDHHSSQKQMHSSATTECTSSPKPRHVLLQAAGPAGQSLLQRPLPSRLAAKPPTQIIPCTLEEQHRATTLYLQHVGCKVQPSHCPSEPNCICQQECQPTTATSTHRPSYGFLCAPAVQIVSRLHHTPTAHQILCRSNQTSQSGSNTYLQHVGGKVEPSDCPSRPQLHLPAAVPKHPYAQPVCLSIPAHLLPYWAGLITVLLRIELCRSIQPV